jgi:hypothetical protein
MDNDNALVVDNRKALGGGPGLHAFIVGVSDYPHLPEPDPATSHDCASPHFGLRKLASPALSACRIARALKLWSQTLTVPLATVRLLLAASPAERLEDHSLARKAARPNKKNFIKAAMYWREDVAVHPDNIALFYFGGHGVQRYLNDQILLLEGFGEEGLGVHLADGVDSQRLIRGMAPSKKYSDMGRRQLFMFDACRFSPPEFVRREAERVGDILAPEDTLDDDRNCAVLYATAPGKLSYATRGRSTVFARSFIQAMNRQGAQQDSGILGTNVTRWSVRASTLADSISELVKLDPTPFRDEQLVESANARSDFVLRKLRRPPRIRISLRLQPAADHKRAALALRNDRFQAVRQSGVPIEPYPYESLLHAGIYFAELKLNATGGKPEGSLTRGIRIGPSEHLFVFDTTNLDPH